MLAIIAELRLCRRSGWAIQKPEVLSTCPSPYLALFGNSTCRRMPPMA
jgi:hypothetical protein